MGCKVILYGRKGVLHRSDVGPEKDFLADFLAAEHARLAQDPQMMRHCRPGKRRRRDDLADVESFAGLEHQQDSLPVWVSQRDENARYALPCGGKGVGIRSLHVYMTSYIVS